MKTIAQQLNIKDFPFEIRDKNGREIYYENSLGFWVRRERNSDGNEIYLQNSEGYWVKSEFDSNGNCIYLENSDGTWCKREYDLEGNLIYYENSDGTIVDKRPKPTCDGKIVEIDGRKYKLTELTS